MSIKAKWVLVCADPCQGGCWGVHSLLPCCAHPRSRSWMTLIAAECCSGSCEEWLGWMGACRVGCRKALGYDVKRRRYWALGGSLGAWRVYVEEAEGTLWGWYEGEHHCFVRLLAQHCTQHLLLATSIASHTWCNQAACKLYESRQR